MPATTLADRALLRLSGEDVRGSTTIGAPLIVKSTGKEIWRVRYDDGFSNVPRPVFAHGLVYIATGFQQPSLLAVRPDGTGDVTKTHGLWRLLQDTFAGTPYAERFVPSEPIVNALRGRKSAEEIGRKGFRIDETFNGQVAANANLFDDFSASRPDLWTTGSGRSRRPGSPRPPGAGSRSPPSPPAPCTSRAPSPPWPTTPWSARPSCSSSRPCAG
jgi:hypothetical protein